jgi:hypothetical protein
LAAIGAGAKLGEKVQDKGWGLATERLKAPQFCGRVVGDQCVDGERRREGLAAPPLPNLSGPQVLRYPARWTWALAGSARFFKRFVAAEFKLKIDGHGVVAGQTGEHQSPAQAFDDRVI